MRYLAAFFLPPLALLLCERPLSAFLNLLWLAAGLVVIALLNLLGVFAFPFFAAGATLHALLVVHQYQADKRQRELIAALGGKLPAPRANWEWDAILMTIAIVLALALGAVVSGLAGGAALRRAAGRAAALPQPRAEQPPALPAIEGWAFGEVQSTYGAPLAADKATGWARWPGFRARFENGTAREVAREAAP